MTAKRKLNDWNDSCEDTILVIADASEDVSDEHVRAIEEAVRTEVDSGSWTIVEGPGW